MLEISQTRVCSNYLHSGDGSLRKFCEENRTKSDRQLKIIKILKLKNTEKTIITRTRINFAVQIAQNVPTTFI